MNKFPTKVFGMLGTKHLLQHSIAQVDIEWNNHIQLASPITFAALGFGSLASSIP